MSFEKARAKINFYTAVDDNRLRFVYDTVLATKAVPGAMAEVGVYKGGSALLIAEADPEKFFFACDTFEGLPDKTVDDLDTIHNKGDFADTSYESVKALLAPYPFAQVIKGRFYTPEVHRRLAYCKYSFVHIDVDLYESTIICLDFFYERLLPGGAIVVDDYGWKDTPGVRVAVDKFAYDQSLEITDSGFNSCRLERK